MAGALYKPIEEEEKPIRKDLDNRITDANWSEVVTNIWYNALEEIYWSYWSYWSLDMLVSPLNVIL